MTYGSQTVTDAIAANFDLAGWLTARRYLSANQVATDSHLAAVCDNLNRREQATLDADIETATRRTPTARPAAATVTHTSHDLCDGYCLVTQSSDTGCQTWDI